MPYTQIYVEGEWRCVCETCDGSGIVIVPYGSDGNYRTYRCQDCDSNEQDQEDYDEEWQ